METNQPINVFVEVHKKSKAARETMRKAREHDTGVRRTSANEEAMREGFDRPATDEPAPNNRGRTQ